MASGLRIDTASKTSRRDQVLLWVVQQVTDRPKVKSLNLSLARHALSKKERMQLLDLLNSQAGKRLGFEARWSGSRKGDLHLRLLWQEETN